MVCESVSFRDAGAVPISCPLLFGGAQVFTSSVKVVGGFPVSELPAIQEADVGGGGSPTYLSALFPGQIKPEKSFYFEKSNLFWTHVFSHTWAGEII